MGRITGIVNFVKYAIRRPQSMVASDGTDLEATARRNAAGDFLGARKYQFLSAGKDGTFGTDDDLSWPKN